ncbi:MAG: 3-oxoacyl-ACP synthase [Chitinophagaceae bacterium]|nr:3-oxoacyl-ACP synthase [Chitinophagaceae bacterium]
MMSKAGVHAHFSKLVSLKIDQLKNQLSDLSASTANETKSTAGDKYETGRAMLQIEQDNVRTQLQQVLEQKAALDTIGIDKKSIIIERGSLILTNNGWFFLSIALGKQLIDAVSVTAISPQSPLGSKMIGLKVSDRFQLNQKDYQIEGLM